MKILILRLSTGFAKNCSLGNSLILIYFLLVVLFSVKYDSLLYLVNNFLFVLFVILIFLNLIFFVVFLSL